MDKKRPGRLAAHRAYDGNVAQMTRKTSKPKKPPAVFPVRSKPDKSKKRAQDQNFEAVVGRKKTPPPGEAKIEKLLAETPKSEAAAPVRYVPLDIPFLVLVLVLVAFGLVMMYSASYAWSLEDYGTPHYYISRQVSFAFLGLGAMLGFTFLDFNRLKPFIPLFFALTFVLMLLVVFIGRTAGGAQRWLELGGVGFQPSELAKIAVIFSMALAIDKAGNRMKTFRFGILPFLLIVGVFIPILLLQKHLSAIVLTAGTAAIMIFIGGASLWYLGGGMAAGVAGLFLLISTTDVFSYVQRRIDVWKDPFVDPRGIGYQTIQSLYAIASGGLFGLGLGQSRQKQLYLPESHNDYVFSIVCEELGMIGGILLLLLFAALIARGFWIAMHAPNKFGTMLAAGIMTKFALQVLMNIAVVTNAMPVTGISLPFFSYGGTSLTLLMAEMGVMLSISKQMRIVKR